MAKRKKKSDVRPQKPKQPSAVVVKSWGLRYEDMPSCEAGEGLTGGLASMLGRSKPLASAWERGQFLRHLKLYGGDTNLTLPEVEIELHLPNGHLETLFETDTEAAQVFNNARRSTRIAILKIYIDQARSGNLSPSMARQLAEMLKREVARTTLDFNSIPTAVMCELFGVTRITLLNWQKDYNAPCNADRKSYNLKSFLVWYANFQVEKINRQPGKYLTGSDDEATRLRNRKTQMQIDEMEKRLVPADRAMGSLLFRAAALDKFIAANGANLYLKIAGLAEEKIKEKLAEYNDGIRQASCSMPANFAELLPEEVAAGFAELMKQLGNRQ